MFSKIFKTVSLISIVCSISYSQWWKNPCYTNDDAMNSTGIDYSSYRSTELRRITVRGVEYHHSNVSNSVTTSEWDNLETNLNNLFSNFGIQFEFQDLEWASGGSSDTYIANSPDIDPAHRLNRQLNQNFF